MYPGVFPHTPERTPSSSQAAADKATVSQRVRDMGRLHEDVLEASQVGRGVMEPPKRLVHRNGEYRSDQAADYDWFFALARKEQARLRGGRWFSQPGKGSSPDEIREKMPLSEWLAHTRGVDAARAVVRGGALQSDRYGGLTRSSLLKDAAHRPETDGTVFYTDAEGVVHPIPPRSHRSTTKTDYGADEAF